MYSSYSSNTASQSFEVPVLSLEDVTEVLSSVAFDFDNEESKRNFTGLFFVLISILSVPVSPGLSFMSGSMSLLSTSYELYSPGCVVCTTLLFSSSSSYPSPIFISSPLSPVNVL